MGHRPGSLRVVTVSEVSFNPFDPDFPANPYPQYAALRTAAPVYLTAFGPWVGKPGWKRGGMGVAGLMPEFRPDGTPGS